MHICDRKVFSLATRNFGRRLGILGDFALDDFAVGASSREQ